MRLLTRTCIPAITDLTEDHVAGKMVKNTRLAYLRSPGSELIQIIGNKLVGDPSSGVPDVDSFNL